MSEPTSVDALCHAGTNNDRGPSLVRDHGDDAYSRARRDQSFLEGVRAAYAGQRDVLQALWWMSHPAEAAPDGTPSPIDQLRELQHRVFSADGDSAGDPDAIVAIRELEAELSAEREAITTAVRAAHAKRDEQRVRPHAPDEQPGNSLVGSSIPDVAEFAWTAEETVIPSEGRTRNVLITLGIVAAMAAGFAIGTQVSALRVAASPRAAPVATTVSTKEACRQISDVYTLLINAQISHDETRINEQEFQGANRLAARMIRRVDTPADKQLERRIDVLKGLVPSDIADSQGQYFDNRSVEWNVASQDVEAACAAAGSSIALESWTGG